MSSVSTFYAPGPRCVQAAYWKISDATDHLEDQDSKCSSSLFAPLSAGSDFTVLFWTDDPDNSDAIGPRRFPTHLVGSQNLCTRPTWFQLCLQWSCQLFCFQCSPEALCVHCWIDEVPPVRQYLHWPLLFKKSQVRSCPTLEDRPDWLNFDQSCPWNFCHRRWS